MFGLYKKRSSNSSFYHYLKSSHKGCCQGFLHIGKSRRRHDGGGSLLKKRRGIANAAGGLSPPHVVLPNLLQVNPPLGDRSKYTQVKTL